MKKPWLSVIIPAYNGAAYIESALRSLIAQQERDFEVIVVDDGSTDETLKIIKGHADRLAMTVIEREHTGNWVANTNLAMSKAKGEYLSWLHQDDTWPEDRLVHLKRLTSENSDAALVLHPSWYIDADGNRLGAKRCPLPGRQTLLQPNQLIEHLFVQNFIAASAPLFKAKAAATVGRLDERLWYVADWDFWLKLTKLGPVVYCPLPLASFRIHSSSLTMTCPDNLEDVRQQYKIVFERHFKLWKKSDSAGNNISRVILFSMNLNLAFMRASVGHRVSWLPILGSFLMLGPVGWYRFLHDSLLLERCFVRLRAGLVKEARQMQKTRC